jgi:hypothetical protein
MRRKARAQSQQGFVSEVGDIEHGAPAQAVLLRQHRQEIHREQQLAWEIPIACRHDRKLNIPPLQPVRQPGAAFLDEAYLDAGVTPPVSQQKIRKQVLDHLRRSSHAEHSLCLPGLEGARALCDRVDLRQHRGSAATSLRRPTSTGRDGHPVEERHAQLGFQRVDLPEAADWVRFSRAAARANPPTSAMATKVRTWASFILMYSYFHRL